MYGINRTKLIDSHHTYTTQRVEVFALSVSAGCGLFLLGNYGVSGDFDSDLEEALFLAVMIVGMMALGGTAIWKLLVIRAEIIADADSIEAEGTSTGATGTVVLVEDDTLVTELSPLWNPDLPRPSQETPPTKLYQDQKTARRPGSISPS